MSEKKELNKEDLNKVSGGLALRNNGANDADKVSGPIEQSNNETTTGNDTFYGPAE